MALVDLRISLDQFGRLTFRQFAALHRRHRQARDREDKLQILLAGRVAAAAYNASGRFKEQITAADLGLDPYSKRHAPTPENQVEVVRGWYAAWVKPKKEDADAE